MNNRLESAKNRLMSELENPPHLINKNYLWEKKYTGWRIKDYVIASHKENVSVGDCKDWFKGLLQENEIGDEYENLYGNSYSKDIERMYDLLTRYNN